MRLSDVPEEVIENIRESDWESFKMERRYQEKVYPNVTYIEQQINEQQTEITTIADLLNEIDNRLLYEVLSSADKLTLEIIILKMQGYSIRESAKKFHICLSNFFFKINIHDKLLSTQYKLIFILWII